MKNIIFAIALLASATQISTAQILDNGFGLNGRAIGNTPGETYAMTVQSDGKIITAGLGYLIPQNHAQLMRFHADGRQDSTFGTNGTVLSEISFSSTIKALVMQPDGKILAGGTYLNGDFANIYHLFISRYNSDGSIDSSFGTNGFVMPEPGYVDELSAMKLQTDGKIVIGGAIASILNLQYTSFLLGRFNADGSADINFGTNGFTTTAISFSSEIKNIALLSDGKIIAGGQSGLGDTQNPDYRSFAVAKYNADGQLDISFGNNGIVITDVVTAAPDFLQDMVLQSDGKILTAGSLDSNHYLVRYQANGNLDSTFGTNGKALRTSFPGTLKLALRNDGKIITACSRTGNTMNADFMMNGYLSNGATNTSFGLNGTVLTDFPTAVPEGSDDYSRCIWIAADGKITLAGNSGGNFALTRYTLNNETGINNTILKNADIKLYPNPVKDRLTIQCKLAGTQLEAALNIINITGQSLFSTETVLRNGETTIALPNLAAGNYILSIKTVKGDYLSYKITKQ